MLMPADAAKVRQQYLDRKHLEYHRKQLEQPKRSTVALAEFVASLINGTNAHSVLDVGCGAGANIYHLSHLLPKAQWTGLD
jgi:trans-aconitate methyltransferase